MVGPPSEELKCFGAVTLRMWQVELNNSPLGVRKPTRVVSPRAQQGRRWLASIKPCCLRDEPH